MKNKKVFFTALIAFCGLFVTLTSFSGTDESTQRYDTGLCGYILPDGTTVLGSRCYTPKSDGPCTRVTDCHFQ